tara:strand:+ start:1776 stop:1958 length:183 start_codon:yes stop_codon:yes gene_type:complete
MTKDVYTQVAGVANVAKNRHGTSATAAKQTGKPIVAGAKASNKAIRLAQVLRRKGQKVEI